MPGNSFTQYQIIRGRRIFNWHSGLNSFSFALVTGNIITLYAMFLGADSAAIGLISSFSFFSYFAIPLGRLLASRKPLLRIYADSWMLRNTSLLLMALIPIAMLFGVSQVGLPLIIISTFLFNFFRGIGLVASNPVIRDLAPGNDRGAYIIRLSIINNFAALFAVLCMAVLLRYLPGAAAFNSAVFAGIIIGFAASLLLYKMPRPRADVAPSDQANLMANFSKAFKDRNFRFFLLVFSIIGCGVGMARPFVIVYCKEVYGQSDSVLTIVTLFSSLGALAMGAVMRLFIDRIGAKPMYIVFSAISLLSLIPAVISPSLMLLPGVMIFICFFGFLTNLGFSGQESAAQTYFFSLIPQQAVMDLSILYFFIMGGTGAAGALFGGVILDILARIGFSPVVVFRIYFIMQILIIACALWFQLKLKSMGSYSLRNTIGMFFSPRDLRALNLLSRLDRYAEDPRKETELLAELRESNTAVAEGKLITHLSSPRFAVRAEALSSMESLPSLSPAAITTVVAELEQGKYTTAYLAARLLGIFRIRDAAAALRTAVNSDDYMLAGESMVALARLNDSRGQMVIAECLAATENPHLLLWGIRAMEIYSNTTSLPILLDILRLDFDVEDVLHEVILALSTLMGFEKIFYRPYSRYIADNSILPELLEDLFEQVREHRKIRDTGFFRLVLDFAFSADGADALMGWFVPFSGKQKGVISAMLAGSVLDTELTRLESFRFCICFWMLAAVDNRKLLLR
ncbi:MAG: MFS transporter [Spirochaetaceae bacterium]|jgi:MFS family permease|nr:MFS transporter [Spirochaetaceae bacterium]